MFTYKIQTVLWQKCLDFYDLAHEDTYNHFSPSMKYELFLNLFTFQSDILLAIKHKLDRFCVCMSGSCYWHDLSDLFFVLSLMDVLLKNLR